MTFDQALDRAQSSQASRTIQSNSGDADTPPEQIQTNGFNTMESLALPDVGGATPDRGIPHARLTAAQVRELWQKGYYTPVGYLYHLIHALRRDGWWLKVKDVQAFCREWEFPRSSFYKAKARLIVDGILQERIHGWVDLRLVSTINSTVHNGDTVSTMETPCPRQKHTVSGRDTPPDQTPTPPESCDSSDLLQINTDLSHSRPPTQPERVEDRELEKFITNRAKSDSSIKNPRGFAKHCLRSDRAHWEAEFLRHQEGFKTRESTPPPPPDLATQRCDTLNAALRRGETEKVGRILADHPEWGLELRDGAVLRSPLAAIEPG